MADRQPQQLSLAVRRMSEAVGRLQGTYRMASVGGGRAHPFQKDLKIGVVLQEHHVMHILGLPEAFAIRQPDTGRDRADQVQGDVMRKLPLDPDVAELAPADSTLTPYDFEHLITYFRLLDADAEGADWREVARIVLHIDPERERRARKAHESHLARARWMTEHGYRHLLRSGWPSLS
jgi:type VI secretion system activator RovC-like protein